MSKEQNNQPNKSNGLKPKFNSYWLYAAIIAVIISFNFFGGDSTSKDISRNKFEELLRANSIENILIVNNDYAEIHLTEEAQSEFKSKQKDNNLPWAAAKPVLTYNFGSLENFENIVRENKEKYNLTIDLKNVNKTDLFDS
ncbi:MAG: ATP-dependent metallopeptidase FtsH/Yme1/Tma family protein, partial [Wenyingzhuangia sp.]